MLWNLRWSSDLLTPRNERVAEWSMSWSVPWEYFDEWKRLPGARWVPFLWNPTAFSFLGNMLQCNFVMHGDMPEEDEIEICLRHFLWFLTGALVLENCVKCIFFRAEVNVAHGVTYAWGVMRVIMYGWTSASEWWRIWHQNLPETLQLFQTKFQTTWCPKWFLWSCTVTNVSEGQGEWRWCM
jgi:hypothetical protein